MSPERAEQLRQIRAELATATARRRDLETTIRKIKVDQQAAHAKQLDLERNTRALDARLTDLEQRITELEADAGY